MGHAIDVGVVDNKKDIMIYATDFAFYNTDRNENPAGSYHNNLEILSDRILDSFEDAKHFLLERYKGYNDGAVQFRNVESVKIPKSIENKTKRYNELYKEWEELKYENHFTNHSSKLITCPSCQSKINSKFIKERNQKYQINKCPVCNGDMRPQSAIDRITKKENKVKELFEEIKKLKKEHQKKVKEKAPIKWAVKVEVHC